MSTEPTLPGMDGEGATSPPPARRHARDTDPATSQEAATEAGISYSRNRLRTLRCYDSPMGATDDEAVARSIVLLHVDVLHGTMAKRRLRAEDAGHIVPIHDEDGGLRTRPTRRGVKAQVFQLTAAGTEAMLRWLEEESDARST